MQLNLSHFQVPYCNRWWYVRRWAWCRRIWLWSAARRRRRGGGCCGGSSHGTTRRRWRPRDVRPPWWQIQERKVQAWQVRQAQEVWAQVEVISKLNCTAVCLRFLVWLKCYSMMGLSVHLPYIYIYSSKYNHTRSYFKDNCNKYNGVMDHKLEKRFRRKNILSLLTEN